mgnify:CR=1 FL=1
MNGDALKQVREDPPLRAQTGFVTLLIQRVQAALVRFFAARHPGGFDVEFGSWQNPDFNLGPGASRPPPRPLVNRDCETTYLAYNAVLVMVEQCNLVEQLRALQQAIDEVSQFIRDEFRCEAPDCRQETGEPVWVGLDCGRNPTTVQAAVLVRLRCVPER